MYRSEEMTRKLASEIVKWKYEKPYDLYNYDVDDIEELMSGSYHGILNENHTLVGYFCTGKEAQVPAGSLLRAYDDFSFIDIGLGMRPDLTGKGKGHAFLSFIISQVGLANLRLTVATFNKRAIKLYEKVGFVQIGDSFTNGRTDFQVMTNRCE